MKALLATVCLLASCSASTSSPPPDAATAAPRDGAAPLPPPDLALAPDLAPPSDLAPACGTCATWASPAKVGTVASAVLTEVSGLAASRALPGVLWAHNDSGGAPTLYALAPTGAALGELVLGDATNVDWEDLALGPCPAGTCLYVADIGDNTTQRSEPYVIYRVPEPGIAPSGAVSVSAERLAFTYQGGERHDAEAFMVHPVTGDAYIVTKKGLGQASSVYKLAVPLATGAVAMKVADLPIPGFLDLPLTGADISPCGDAVLLRTYNAIYRLALSSGAAFDTIFAAAPVRVPAATEPQGEAVCFAPDGRGYYTLSELNAQPIYFTGCAP